jgi:hypothetical protein
VEGEEELTVSSAAGTDAASSITNPADAATKFKWIFIEMPNSFATIYRLRR